MGRSDAVPAVGQHHAPVFIGLELRIGLDDNADHNLAPVVPGVVASTVTGLAHHLDDLPLIGQHALRRMDEAVVGMQVGRAAEGNQDRDHANRGQQAV